MTNEVILSKETLETLAVKTESEQQSRIIVALFEAAGFKHVWRPWDYGRAHMVYNPYVYYYNMINLITYNPTPEMLEALTLKKVTFEEFLCDYCAPEWAVDLRYKNGEYVWTNGDNTVQMFNGTVHHHKTLTDNIIYTRPEPARKTLQDALDKYKDGWPQNYTDTKYIGIGWIDENYGMVQFIKGLLIDKEVSGSYKICTRGEFIKAHAERSKPQWPEPGSLPPVGEEVEFRIGNLGNYYVCIIEGYSIDKSAVLVRDGEDYDCLYCDDTEFRPIQTERERFVEQAIGGYDVIGAKAFAGNLYDRLKSGELEAPKVDDV